MDNNLHEVEFDKYCPMCKYVNYDQEEKPCTECLEHPAGVGTRKPKYFKDSRLR